GPIVRSAKSGAGRGEGVGRCRTASPGPNRTKAGQRAADAVSFFVAFAAFFRLSEVCAPNFFVKRSTRPSVSISFWRPVKNGWQFEQISRCSCGLVDRVFQLAP